MAVYSMLRHFCHKNAAVEHHRVPIKHQCGEKSRLTLSCQIANKCCTHLASSASFLGLALARWRSFRFIRQTSIVCSKDHIFF